MSNEGTGKIFVMSAPSGGGKTTLDAEVLAQNPNLARSVSMTTRSPRPGEKSGDDYVFVSEPEFEKVRKQDGFLESATVFGRHYGTPKKFVEDQLRKGKDVLLVIDVQGAMAVKKKRPDAVLIFVNPPSMKELERRLRERKTDSEDAIQLRLKVARDEMAKSKEYDYRVTNDDLKKAAAETNAIIQNEKRR